MLDGFEVGVKISQKIYTTADVACMHVMKVTYCTALIHIAILVD